VEQPENLDLSSYAVDEPVTLHQELSSRGTELRDEPSPIRKHLERRCSGFDLVEQVRGRGRRLRVPNQVSQRVQ
jgi:hypothetical protein